MPGLLETLPVEILVNEVLQQHCQLSDETETLIWQLRLRLCNKALCAIINQTIVKQTLHYMVTEKTPHWLLLQLTSLTSLNTRVCYSGVLDDAAVRRMPALKALSLGGCENQVTDQGLSLLTALEKLNLWCNYAITDRGLLPLASHLRWLNLTQNTRISETALEQMTALQELWLFSNISISAQVRLPQSLTALDLSSDRLNDQTLLPLRNLHRLSLLNTRHVTDSGLSQLTALTALSLNNQSTITDRSVCQLTQLCKLQLTANQNITDVSLLRLTALRTLSLHSNQAQLFTTAFVMPALRKVSIIACRAEYYPTYPLLCQQTQLTQLELGMNRSLLLHADFFRPLVQLQKMIYITSDCAIARLVSALPAQCIVNDQPLSYYKALPLQETSDEEEEEADWV
jgi:hypothetical protein